MTALLAFLALAVDPERMEWTVDGAAREALVTKPSKPGDGKAPLVAPATAENVLKSLKH